MKLTPRLARIFGLLLFLPLGLIPWERPAIRFGVALIVGGGIAAYLIVQGYDAKYPLVR